MIDDVLSEDQLDSMIDAFDCLGLEISVDHDYSGRAMYGARCLAFSADLPPAVLAAQVALALADVTDLATARDAMAGVRTDSLGRGFVIYFPGLTVA